MTHTLEKPSAKKRGADECLDAALSVLAAAARGADHRAGRYGRGCGGAVWRGCAIGWVMAQGARLAHAVARGLCRADAGYPARVSGQGGENGAGFYVQQAMFWFPVVFAGYARERDDSRLWRWVRPLLLSVVTVTTLTTIGWLIQGMLRGGRVYAYSRSLGYGAGGEAQEAYLKELMLRNIGGYDFVYATVAALPLTCLGIQRSGGWRARGFLRAAGGSGGDGGAVAIYLCHAVLRQDILVVEGLALVVRSASRGRVGLGGVPPVGRAAASGGVSAARYR